MSLNDIYELMEKFEHSSLASLELEVEEFSIKLGKAAPMPPMPTVAPTGAASVPAAPAGVPAAAAAADSGNLIKAPLVGTFYRSASPEAEPYTAVGKTVKKGEILCLIEAMKMMNEIPAPFDCTVEQVLAEDGALVEFDQPLFSVKQG